MNDITLGDVLADIGHQFRDRQELVDLLNDSEVAYKYLYDQSDRATLIAEGQPGFDDLVTDLLFMMGKDV